MLWNYGEPSKMHLHRKWHPNICKKLWSYSFSRRSYTLGSIVSTLSFIDRIILVYWSHIFSERVVSFQNLWVILYDSYTSVERILYVERWYTFRKMIVHSQPYESYDMTICFRSQKIVFNVVFFVSNLIFVFPIYFYFINLHCFQCMFPIFILPSCFQSKNFVFNLY